MNVGDDGPCPESAGNAENDGLGHKERQFSHASDTRRAQTCEKMLQQEEGTHRRSTVAQEMLKQMTLKLDHVFGAQPNSPLLVEHVGSLLIIAYVTAAGIVVLQKPDDESLGDFSRTENLLLRKHEEAVLSLALCPVTGSYLVSCGKDATYVWDIKAGFEGEPFSKVEPYRKLQESDVDDGHFNCVSFWVESNDRWFLLAGSHGGNLFIFKPFHHYALYHTVTCHQSAILSMSVHAKAERVATGATDGTVRVWTLALSEAKSTAKPPQKVKEKRPEDDLLVPESLDVASDESDEEESNVYDDSFSSLIATFAAHRGDVSAITFAPDCRVEARILISGGRDNVMQVLDVDAQQILNELGQKDDETSPYDFRHQGSIRRIATLPVKQETPAEVASLFQVVSCSNDGTVRSWIAQAKFVEQHDDKASTVDGSQDASMKSFKDTSLDFLNDPVGDALSEVILGSLFENESNRTGTAQLVSSVEAILSTDKKSTTNDDDGGRENDTKVFSTQLQIKSKLLYKSTVGPSNKYGVFDLSFCMVPPVKGAPASIPPRVLLGCSSTRSIVRFFGTMAKYPELSPEGAADDIFEALKRGPAFQSSVHSDPVTSMEEIETEVLDRFGKAPHRAVASVSTDGAFCLSFPADCLLIDSRGCGWANGAIKHLSVSTKHSALESQQAQLSDITAFAGCRNGTVYQLLYSEEGQLPDEEAEEEDEEKVNMSEKSERNYWPAASSYDAHAADVSALAYEPSLQIFVTAGSDFSLAVWDATSNPGKKGISEALTRYENAHDGIVTALDFFPTDLSKSRPSFMASGGTDGRVCCWRLLNQSGNDLRMHKVWTSKTYDQNGTITSLQFGRNMAEGLLVSSTWGGHMNVWRCFDPRRNSEAAKLRPDGAWSTSPKYSWENLGARITGMTLSPSGAMVACVSSTGLVRICDMTDDFSVICAHNVLQDRIYSCSVGSIAWPQDNVIIVGTSYGELLRLNVVFEAPKPKSAENPQASAEDDVETENSNNLLGDKKEQYSMEALLQFTGVPGLTVDDLKVAEDNVSNRQVTSRSHAYERNSSIERTRLESTSTRWNESDEVPVMSNPLNDDDVKAYTQTAYAPINSTTPSVGNVTATADTSSNEKPSSGNDLPRKKNKNVPVVTENPASDYAPMRRHRNSAVNVNAKEKTTPKDKRYSAQPSEKDKLLPSDQHQHETVESGNPIRHAKDAASFRERFQEADTDAKRPEEREEYQPTENQNSEYEADAPLLPDEEGETPQELQEKSDFEPVRARKE